MPRAAGRGAAGRLVPGCAACSRVLESARRLPPPAGTARHVQLQGPGRLRREHEPMVMLEHARMCAPVPEEEEKSGMGVAMALAVASRSGLLGAMLKDDTPKTAEEWAGLSRASRRETDAVLASLASGKVVDRMGGEDARFRVPADRAGAVKDMGPVFEALLMHQRGKMDPQATLNLVKFRCEKILAGQVAAYFSRGEASER